MDGSQGRGDGERAVPAQDEQAPTTTTTENETTTTREHVETTGPATEGGASDGDDAE